MHCHLMSQADAHEAMKSRSRHTPQKKMNETIADGCSVHAIENVFVFAGAIGDQISSIELDGICDTLNDKIIHSYLSDQAPSCRFLRDN